MNHKHIFSVAVIASTLFLRTECMNKGIGQMSIALGDSMMSTFASQGRQRFLYNYNAFLVGTQLINTASAAVVASGVTVIAATYLTKSLWNGPVTKFWESSRRTKLCFGAGLAAAYLASRAKIVEAGVAIK